MRSAVIEVGRWPLKFFGLLMRIRLRGFGQSPLHSLFTFSGLRVGVGLLGTAVIEGPVPPQKKKRFCLHSPLSHPSFPLISISTPHLLHDTPLPPSSNQLPLASGGQGLGRCGWRFQHFISPDEYISIGTLVAKGGRDLALHIQTGRSRKEH